MSLIERMIQRTRAPRSSGIQPLLLPRFATSVGTRQADDTPLESNRANPLGSIADSLANLFRTTAAVGEESQAGSAPALSTRLFQQETRGVPPEERRQSSDNLGEGDSFPAVTQRRKAAHNAASQHVEEISAAAKHVERSPQSSAEPVHSPVTTFSADRVQAISQQHAVQSSFSNSARQRSHFDDDSGEKTAPDVSITIGHIEVHAAQPAERIPRPAFRPRVSLDDFLGQHSGKKS